MPMPTLQQIIGTITGKVAFERTQANFTTIKDTHNALETVVGTKAPNADLVAHKADIMSHIDIREQINSLENIVNMYHPPRTLLYYQGDECVDVTGGWEAVGTGVGVVTKQTDRIRMYKPNTGGGGTWLNSANMVDATDYSRLKVEVNLIIGNSIYAGLSTTKTDSGYVANILTTELTGLQVIEVDISSVTGMYYVALLQDTSVSSIDWTFEISKIWFE